MCITNRSRIIHYALISRKYLHMARVLYSYIVWDRQSASVFVSYFIQHLMKAFKAKFDSICLTSLHLSSCFNYKVFQNVKRMFTILDVDTLFHLLQNTIQYTVVTATTENTCSSITDNTL